MCPGMDERPYKLSTPLSAHVRPQGVRDTREAVCERGPGG